MKKNLIAIGLVLCALTTSAQTFTYLFNNNLNEFGGARSLNELVSCGAVAGGYSSQTFPTSTGICANASVAFNFNPGGGLEFPNADAIIGGTYTINFFFAPTSALGGYMRLIDFSNSTSDAGIYIFNNCLNFFPAGNVGPSCPFVQGEFSLISLVRDGSTGIVEIYINGTPYTTYNDVGGTYLPSPVTDPIIFFRDDVAVPCEVKAGTIKYLSISNGLATATEISTLYANVCAVALPVSWGTFDVRNQSGVANLYWQTLNEQNTDHFEVERSYDAKNFSVVGKVIAGGNNNGSSYRYNDETGLGAENYYRVKSVDKNGESSYSATQKLTVAGKSFFSIHPNPATDYLIINNITAGEMIELLTVEGKKIKAIVAASTNINIPIDDLPKGMYIVQIRGTKGGAQKKFIKL